MRGYPMTGPERRFDETDPMDVLRMWMKFADSMDGERLPVWRAALLQQAYNATHAMLIWRAGNPRPQVHEVEGPES